MRILESAKVARSLKINDFKSFAGGGSPQAVGRAAAAASTT